MVMMTLSVMVSFDIQTNKTFIIFIKLPKHIIIRKWPKHYVSGIANYVSGKSARLDIQGRSKLVRKSGSGY